MLKYRALVLAALQTADLAVTQLSPRYGDDHLDHLGVPVRLRQALPLVKTGAVAGLILSWRGRSLRRMVGATLVPYYAAAVTFHVLSQDPPTEALPAAACAALAASLIWP
jgi:hypothetical protein